MKYLKGFIIMAISVTIAGFATGQMNQDTQQGQQDRQHMMPGQDQQQTQRGHMKSQGQGMMSRGMMQGNTMHGGMTGMMHGGMMGMHTPSVHTILMQSDRLNMTTDQLKTLQQQSLNLRKDLADLHTQLQKHQIEYQEYLLSDNIRQNRVHKYIDATNKIEVEVQKRMAESYFSAKEVLNDEQQDNLIVMHPGMQMMQQSGENSMGMRDHQNMMQQN